MLSGNARKRRVPFALGAVATSARRDTFFGDSIGEDRLARGDALGVSFDLLAFGLLCRKMGGQFLDLAVAEVATQAPHVFISGWIRPAMTLEPLQLRDKVGLRLSRQIRKVRRTGV